MKILYLGFLFLFISIPLWAKNPMVLSCEEFNRLITFVEEEHLRSQYLNESQKKEIFLQAIQKTGNTLRLLGYPLFQAWFDRALAEKIKLKLENNRSSLCLHLQNSLFRSAFLKAYLKELDPYSDFYLSEEVDLNTSLLDGEFTGVGIGTKMTELGLEVTEVVEGSPAHGKLLKGDKITHIDHHSVDGLSEMDVRLRIRGSSGAPVLFSGERQNKLFQAKVIRGKVYQKAVSWAWHKDKILTLKIHRFFKQTVPEVIRILKQYEKETRGIILDLRNNPGGLLQSARDLLALFLSPRLIVYLKGKDYEDQVWSFQEGLFLNLPLVVLVNEGTASASEIVAGVLQDYGRALIIGSPTYGKDSVQNIYETQTALGMNYRGGLKITTLWYYLPSGRSVHLLKPDVLLASDSEKREKPLMPYQAPSFLSKNSHFSFSKKFESIIQNSSQILTKTNNSEEVGRKILFQMLAQN